MIKATSYECFVCFTSVFVKVKSTLLTSAFQGCFYIFEAHGKSQTPFKRFLENKLKDIFINNKTKDHTYGDHQSDMRPIYNRNSHPLASG